MSSKSLSSFELDPRRPTAALSNTFTLSEADSLAVADLARDIRDRYDSVEDPRFLKDARMLARRLPLDLLWWTEQMRHSDDLGWFRIRGVHIDEAELGRTPPVFEPVPRRPALTPEISLVLFASLLGDVFGWETQQNARLVHDLVPGADQVNSQTSASSAVELGWHTEDAFHPYRADYLLLGCLRNPDDVPTTLAQLRDLDLSEPVRGALEQPSFHHLPDTSHSPAASGDGAWVNPPRLPVLYGARACQSMCIDADFTMVADDSSEAAGALAVIRDEISARLSDVALAPGDFLFVDNHRCVHGRRAFEARFDGTDRWLKRVSVTRDLRKMSDAGVTGTSRVAAASKWP
ncbi:MAG: guanitoxin biosynthesis L-enduracididine beta-hydroxylase GntD [Nocardioides sp.]